VEIEDGFFPGGYTQLFVDFIEMVFNGFLGDKKLLRDLKVCLSCA